MKPYIQQFIPTALSKPMFYARILLAHEDTFEQWALKRGYFIQKEGKRYKLISESTSKPKEYESSIARIP